ncbi:DUF1489 domain-containing protein [Sphingomonas sp. LB-2]|uniref:DUF1489 family protein n=1 Tax=Sphingomonas caeni TaxID=2984949 RepID=UPI00222E6DE6|nr:DUF1489 domain-containing protein [Sphingomonas caeni]MCW3846827.1 DUF1489 domain-containing protein [Sphingomonas caeni]
MPLHLTKVAFGCTQVETLRERIEWRAAQGPEFPVTTRYLPKRFAELEDGGSLYWIIRHQLVARSPILGFAEAEGGRTAIRLAAELILVQPRPKRAHQGWRYLEDADAPVDLGEGDAADLPAELAGKLAGMGLL